MPESQPSSTMDPIAACDDLLIRLQETADEDEKSLLQERLFAHAYQALLVDTGPAELFPLAPRFHAAGLFAGSDWQHPHGLQAGLVENTLSTPEGLATECCNLLRFLALAEGEDEHPKVEPEEARSYLERVLALNVDSLFPVTPYQHLAEGDVPIEAVQRLFQFIIDRLGVDGVMTRLVVEAERLLITRPIKIERIRRMIDTAASGMAAWGGNEVAREAALLVDALHGPTPLGRACDTLADYSAALADMDDPSLLLEADTMSTYVRRTGLVSPHHALLVRFALDHSRRLLYRALGIEDTGRCSVRVHSELVRELIDVGVWPATAQCVSSLGELLERGVLFNPAVPAGLRTLLDIPLQEEVESELAAGIASADPPPPRSILIAGILNVLGLPRGVDQGHNPTCQSARAISLWAQVDPGYLLHHVVQAARDGSITMYFEGQAIHSSEVERGVADELHTELDSISLLLTPHLDRCYWQMSLMALDRGEDEHKWVNPEFHGWWVERGFAALIDEDSGVITDAEDFVRLFYASYHPHCNGGRVLMVPQPCGIAITNIAGAFLDWHAIAIQRVAVDPHGALRVYFFNPNHDKGQDWGQGVVTSTCDHGEVEGESSLPFPQFVSRLYVFHYDPLRIGDPAAVDPDEVEPVLQSIRTSWARSFPWADAIPADQGTTA